LKNAEPIYVAGTGSYAAEIAEYAAAAGLRVAGLVELIDPTRIGSTIHGFQVFDADAVPKDGALLAIAAGSDRSAKWAALAEHGWAAVTIVHAAAVVSPSVNIGSGSIVGPTAVIGAQTELAEQVLIGRGALIGHHVTLGDGVVINPGANLGGNTHVGAGSAIGMGATIVNGLTIGVGATIAAGSVVVRDVAAGSRVQGVPAQEFVRSPV
jgi:sugar O-acyltransferase (sialic acid O-acetyltransferase NeuD family)